MTNSTIFVSVSIRQCEEKIWNIFMGKSFKFHPYFFRKCIPICVMVISLKETFHFKNKILKSISTCDSLFNTRTSSAEKMFFVKTMRKFLELFKLAKINVIDYVTKTYDEIWLFLSSSFSPFVISFFHWNIPFKVNERMVAKGECLKLFSEKLFSIKSVKSFVFMSCLF